MAIKVITTFTKSDESTESYSNDAINSQIEKYFDSGKITQKPVKEVDGLVETYTTTFKDRASLDQFKLDFAGKEIDRQRWLDDNNVSFEIRYVEE
tara:strand:+ start:1776 stop:2060 length:285 start_codon:yes stop_codon:yes gene_type:complete